VSLCVENATWCPWWRFFKNQYFKLENWRKNHAHNYNCNQSATASISDRTKAPTLKFWRFAIRTTFNGALRPVTGEKVPLPFFQILPVEKQKTRLTILALCRDHQPVMCVKSFQPLIAPCDLGDYLYHDKILSVFI
jgi:hypothetical protein